MAQNHNLEAKSSGIGCLEDALMSALEVKYNVFTITATYSF